MIINLRQNKKKNDLDDFLEKIWRSQRRSPRQSFYWFGTTLVQFEGGGSCEKDLCLFSSVGGNEKWSDSEIQFESRTKPNRTEPTEPNRTEPNYTKRCSFGVVFGSVRVVSIGSANIRNLDFSIGKAYISKAKISNHQYFRRRRCLFENADFILLIFLIENQWFLRMEFAPKPNRTEPNQKLHKFLRFGIHNVFLYLYMY